MVAGHVGHYCHIELAAVEPVLRQPVGGSLQHRAAAASLHHLRQHGLHLRRLRRGETAAIGQRTPGGPVLRGAYQPHALTRRLQDMGDEVAKARLAIGAGDTDDGEPSSRPAEEGGRCRSKRRARVGHRQTGYSQPRPLGTAIRLH